MTLYLAALYSGSKLDVGGTLKLRYGPDYNRAESVCGLTCMVRQNITVHTWKSPPPPKDYSLTFNSTS